MVPVDLLKGYIWGEDGEDGYGDGDGGRWNNVRM